MSCEEGIVASIDTGERSENKSYVRIRMRWRKGLAGTLRLAAISAEEEKDVRSLPGRVGAWLAESPMSGSPQIIQADCMTGLSGDKETVGHGKGIA